MMNSVKNLNLLKLERFKLKIEIETYFCYSLLNQKHFSIGIFDIAILFQG